MNKEDNIFLVTLIMAVILLLFTVTSLYMAKENEKEKRINLQRELDGVKIEKQNLDSRLKETEIARAEAISNIKMAEEKISMLSGDLGEEKAANAANILRVQEKEFEVKSLKAKIEEVKIEKQAAMTDLEKLNERFLSMKFQLENLMKTKEELEIKAHEIVEQEGVSLGTVVIKQSRN